VQWGSEVTSLTRTATGVRATVTSNGSQATVHARYVVGADGARSIVRQAAGIGFSGEMHEESFVLADVEMHWSPGRHEVTIFCSPRGLAVVAPLPGLNRYRIVATLDRAPEQMGVEHVQSLLDERGPTRAALVTHVRWSSWVRVHHRVAARYRHGPFFLVGDAAHVQSPAGGQGMNTGLVDACVLGEMLAAVLTGKRSDAYLDGYERQRRPAAISVLALAFRLTRLAVMKNPVRRAIRNLALRCVGWWPVPSWKLKMDLSGLSRRAAADLP
jgi:2-polyprenyl-6-methoxyphenol hydroxylase-like FAD-dependent oxidoreductase